VKRSPKRKSGQSGGGIVLTQVRNVRESGSRERQEERDSGLTVIGKSGEARLRSRLLRDAACCGWLALDELAVDLFHHD